MAAAHLKASRKTIEQRAHARTCKDLGHHVLDLIMSTIGAYVGEQLSFERVMSLAEYRMSPLACDLVISVARVYDVTLPRETELVYVGYLPSRDDLRRIQDKLWEIERTLQT